jgi:hypothetical protein
VVQDGEVPSGSCDIDGRYTPLLVDPSEDHRVDVFLDYQRATICNLRQAMQHSVHPQISIRPLHGVTHVALHTVRQAVVGDVLQKLPQLADRRQELRLKLIAAMRHGNMLVRAPWDHVGTTGYESVGEIDNGRKSGLDECLGVQVLRLENSCPDFVAKFCEPDVFPLEVFSCGAMAKEENWTRIVRKEDMPEGVFVVSRFRLSLCAFWC